MKHSLSFSSIPTFLLCCILVVTSCKKETAQPISQPTPPISGNRSPLAKAGADQRITLPNNVVTLNGSGSTDPDNNITSYVWAKISGPPTFNIVNAYTVQTQVKDLTQGVYQFELRVTDNGGLSAKDTVQVFVNVYSVVTYCDNRPIINARLVPVGNLSIGAEGLVSATASNKILFAGGVRDTGNGARVDIYDITTNKWSTAELSKGDRQGIAVAAVGNKIFFAGGEQDPFNTSLSLSRVDIYDALNNTWSTAELSEARTGISAATIGSKVFFAGGSYWQNAYVYSNVVDIYDNATNNWSTASLSEARTGISATTAGNKIYFAGGQNGTSSSRIDIFDASTNTWSTSNLLEAKSNMAGIAVANKIYWAGGFASFFSIPQNGLSNKVEIRDLITGITTFNCVIPRLGNSAVIKGDNIVFFTGYFTDYENSPLEGTHFEIYNTTKDTWSTGVLNQKIVGASVISVNNTIYVAGGRETVQGYRGPFFKQVWKLEF